jgi:hypothetical protein
MRKEMLLFDDELRLFQKHSTQMAALDYLVSVTSDVFIPSNDGNMAKVVEGHRRYAYFSFSFEVPTSFENVKYYSSLTSDSAKLSV